MNLNLCKSCLSTIFVCLYCSLTFFAQSELPKGELIERVEVQSDSAQGYALYLPKSYTPEKKWAILYAFEPLGRGKLPVSIYQEAAEKYGVIVVGSYNSRNGLDGASLSKVLSALWDDTHQRFSIDERRVYATGFSGGSRVASIFAASCQCVTGVIGSGAGFSVGLQPSPSLSFIYFSAIGFDDYNYYEIRQLKKLLEEAKMTHRLERFDGAHQWLPKELTEEALAWMQLYAMKKGSMPKDEKFINDNFQVRLTKSESYLNKNQYLEAFQGFSTITIDFKGLLDVSAIEEKVRNLQNSDELKKALKDEDNQIQIQERHTSFILSEWAKLERSEERLMDLANIRSYIAKLQKTSEEKDDSPARRIARRSLNQVYANSYETALFTYERAKKYNQALNSFELANEIYPKNLRIPYDRARVYALSGQKKKALEFLEKAVSLGYKNWQELESEKGFDNIRQEEKFQKLLTQIKAINN